MAATNVTVGTSATLIVSKSRSSNTARTGLLIKNNGSQAIYLGETSSVTTSNGYPLASGAEMTFDYKGGKSQFFYRGDVYGIAGGSVDVRVWELLETR